MVPMSLLLNSFLDIGKLSPARSRQKSTDFTVAGLFDELRPGNLPPYMPRIRVPRGRSKQAWRSLIVIPIWSEQILKNLVWNAIKYTRQGFVPLRCAN